MSEMIFQLKPEGLKLLTGRLARLSIRLGVHATKDAPVVFCHEGLQFDILKLIDAIITKLDDEPNPHTSLWCTVREYYENLRRAREIHNKSIKEIAEHVQMPERYIITWLDLTELQLTRLEGLYTRAFDLTPERLQTLLAGWLREGDNQ